MYTREIQIYSVVQTSEWLDQETESKNRHKGHFEEKEWGRK